MSAILAALRELSVLMSQAIARTVGDAYSSNGAVLLLTHLADHGPSRSGVLGRVAHLTRGGMSNMLKRLEHDGLVERAPGREDGRSVLVSLTPEGHRVEQRLRDAVASALAESQPVVKELIVLLVELGASPPTPLPEGGDKRERSLTAAIAEVGATIGEVVSGWGSAANAMTLAALDVEGPCRVGRVAELLGITSGGATRLVDQLDAEGLVRRTRGVAGDSRGVVVSLTERGEQRLAVIAEQLVPHLDGVLDLMRSAMLDLTADL